MDALRELLRSDPVQARKLLERLQQYVLVPHTGGQLEVLNDNSRFKVLNAGRRWGKTKIGSKLLVQAALERPRQITWWVAPTYRVVKRGYRDVLKQLPRDLLVSEPPPETNFDAGRPVILKLKNESSIEFYSAERPGGMLGEGVNYVIVDEAATIPALVWEQVIRPTLSDTQGRGLLISTPRGRNWFYKRWMMGQDAQEPEWASWTFPSVTNPYLEEEEVEAARNELPTLTFEQEFEAKFLAAGSSVFLWDDKALQMSPILENGLVEDVKVKGQVFLGVDLAKTVDFTVLYGANELDLRNVFYERFHGVRWGEQKRRIRRAVSTIERAGADGVTLVMDATGVGDPIVEEMEDNGYDVISVNFTTLKNKMVSAFGKDLERSRAFILESAELAEFENYEMSSTPKGVITFSAPEGEHDDVVSAKILQHWGITTEGSPDVTAISASSPVEAKTAYDEGDDYVPEGDSWDDLIENDGSVELQERKQELEDMLAPLSPEQLLNREGVWH